MCHIVSYLHRLHDLKNILNTDFVYINMQHSTFFFYFSFLRWSKYFPLLVVREHFRCVFILASIVLSNTRFFFLHYCSSMCATPYDTSLLRITPLDRLFICPLNKPVHCRRTCLWQPYLLDYCCCHFHVNLSSVMILLVYTESFLENKIHSASPPR